MKNLLLILLGFLFFNFSFAQNSTFIQGKIVVKVKAQYADKCNKSNIQLKPIQAIVASEEITNTTKVFPNHVPTKNKNSVDLSNLYYFEFGEGINAKKLVQQLKNLKEVEYAEQIPINQITYTPSDSLNSDQWYLNAVNAYQAWDVQQGDTNIVIAFTDTGTDTDHPDLVDNYAYNYDDPINGIDDDNDGFIDNFLGWDVADNDNDVGFGNFGHGVNVGGIASATTDNLTGISGLGFNTKLLPIKIDESATGRLTAAYEGIVYAADQGAFIITNSWGSHVFSRFSQDIINYATLNKGSLVIAATGNNGDERRFYPAAYENVLSVGSMQFNDTVKANSNYGYWADIFAPGEDMLTTNAIGGYGYNGGTSMAAPVVAGVAGLVKAQFPSYDWRQVTEQILNTGEDIYAVNEARYANKLGSGQLDAFKALTDSTQPGIVLINRTVTDGDDGIFAIGDTLQIRGSFLNVLKDASNVNIELKTIDNRLQILNGTRSVVTLNSGDSISLMNDPFLVIIPSGVDINETIEFEVTITATGYLKRQFFPLDVNIDYLTINENNLRVTLTSNGSIGFSGSNNQLGDGFQHLGSNSHLFEGSFMLGTSNAIADRFRGENQGADNDFKVVTPVNIKTPKAADFEANSVFNDGNLNASPNFKVDQNWHVFQHADANNSIIYEYIVENTSGNELSGVYAGIIIDWDIADFSRNKIAYDAQKSMGISFSADTSIFIGTRILNDSIPHSHYGIDNTNNGNGGVNVNDGFSTEEKFTVLSTVRNTAGEFNPEGNDIIEVNSYGPFDLEFGERIQLAFSITVSDNINNLSIESDSIYSLFTRSILGNPGRTLINDDPVSLYPNPTKDLLFADIRLSEPGNIRYNIINAEGQIIIESPAQFFTSGVQRIRVNTSHLETGLYFLTIRGDNFSSKSKFVVSQ